MDGRWVARRWGGGLGGERKQEEKRKGKLWLVWKLKKKINRKKVKSVRDVTQW